MKTLKFTIGVIVILALVPTITWCDELVTLPEVYTVATNWIALIIHNKGSWGGAPEASVTEIEELRRDDRLLGYWCHIEPTGHIVVSLRKELAPVKASSETWDGDPTCDVDIVDVIKFKIEQAHDFIESRIGPVETAPPDEVEALAEFSYRETWTRFSQDPAAFERQLPSDPALTNYTMGGVLLTSNWHQASPYNRFCQRDSDCVGDHHFGRCAVGCVATAGAQIMKYWCWPPYGTGHPYDDPYGWPLMPDTLWASSPPERIDAVANLCREVGHAVGMVYCSTEGECGSSAYTSDMEGVFEDCFRYHGSAVVLRHVEHNRNAWFGFIKATISLNMPAQYRVPDHSIVCDGWEEYMLIKRYHMNYGWGGRYTSASCWDPYRDSGISSNTWFLLDALPCSDWGAEYMVFNIHPNVSLWAVLGPVYGQDPSFPYRYVNVDASGNDVTFHAGQLIQFLPGVIMKGTSTTGSAIRIYGSPTLHTRLFTRGDMSRGVLIENGGMTLSNNGAILLY